MQSNLLALSTSPELLTKLSNSRLRRPTATENLEQRVSFVYGAMAKDSGVTKERVRQVLLEQVAGTQAK